MRITDSQALFRPTYRLVLYCILVGLLGALAALAFDFLVENPIRDIIMMTGVTDLTTVVDVESAVTSAAGAKVEVVQETLFQ